MPVRRSAPVVWQKSGYDIVRCASCGLLFRGELPDDDAVRELYDEGYFRDHVGARDRHGYADYLNDSASHRANAQDRLQLLGKYSSEPGRLLDVGCAAGFFIDEARRMGWDASGVDVSAVMTTWAATQLGVQAEATTFAEADVPTRLDAITMWDYIEHSTDPHGDLVKAAEHLRPGGVLALSTGDVGSLSARVAGRRWHLLTPEHHNFFFDRRTLGRLLERAGFEVVEQGHRRALYSSGHLIYKLAALTSVATLRSWAHAVGRSRLGSARIPLNFFDILTVVARRPA